MSDDATAPDVKTIIERSVAANATDFNAAPEFNHKVTERGADGSKTYEVTMIDGSPYRRLIAVNGEPLAPRQDAEERKKQRQAAAQRQAESPGERQARIAKYQRDRSRDRAMMAQLTEAFTFQLVGTRMLNSFTTYVLKAVPRPNYQPPNLQTKVLKGMQGELWIDQQSYQWVKVRAEVIHPVSIEGFLARVYPGTSFELEKAPVRDGIWQPSHFAMRSRARVLLLVDHNSQEEDTYFDYQPVARSPLPDRKRR